MSHIFNSLSHKSSRNDYIQRSRCIESGAFTRNIAVGSAASCAHYVSQYSFCWNDSGSCLMTLKLKAWMFVSLSHCWSFILWKYLFK